MVDRGLYWLVTRSAIVKAVWLFIVVGFIVAVPSEMLNGQAKEARRLAYQADARATALAVQQTSVAVSVANVTQAAVAAQTQQVLNATATTVAQTQQALGATATVAAIPTLTAMAAMAAEVTAAADHRATAEADRGTQVAAALATEAAIPPTAVPTPVVLNFKGTGQQVSPKFQLHRGLAIFHMTHKGRRNFSMPLLDSQGEYIELLVNRIGTFDGSKAVGIKTDGTYVLDIAADGAWTVTVQQPTAAMAEETSPLNFMGTGQQVSPLFTLGKGLTTFHLTHTKGKSNFAVFLMDGEGNSVELLVNTIGAFDGSKAATIRTAGSYILDISADGDWTITTDP